MCATSGDCLIWWWHVQVGEGCSWWQGRGGLFYRQVILNAVPTGPNRRLLKREGNTERVNDDTEKAEAHINTPVHPANTITVLTRLVLVYISGYDNIELFASGLDYQASVNTH